MSLCQELVEEDNPAISLLTHALCHIVDGLALLGNRAPPRDHLTREES